MIPNSGELRLDLQTGGRERDTGKGTSLLKHQSLPPVAKSSPPTRPRLLTLVNQFHQQGLWGLFSFKPAHSCILPVFS